MDEVEVIETQTPPDIPYAFSNDQQLTAASPSNLASTSTSNMVPPAPPTFEVSMIECGCCYGDANIEEMVQCSEGHLFCIKCLKGYADEAIHGQGKSQLLCMTANCGTPFPRSQLQRALTEDLIKKFDERLQEESLNMANLENLVRCPDCNYAAEIVDEEQKVFACPQCKKVTCRYCHIDWNGHEGLACEQVEKKDETSIRTKYEEMMTQARLRHCPKCKAPMLKDGGCNRVTCRCGSTICYVCRSPDISYDHFCQHVGPHRTGCKSCSKCSLWSDPEEDERKLIEQLKKQGKIERSMMGFLDDKDIGAPEDKPPAPRYAQRMQDFAQRHAYPFPNDPMNYHGNPPGVPPFGGLYARYNPYANLHYMPPPPPIPAVPQPVGYAAPLPPPPAHMVAPPVRPAPAHIAAPQPVPHNARPIPAPAVAEPPPVRRRRSREARKREAHDSLLAKHQEVRRRIMIEQRQKAKRREPVPAQLVPNKALRLENELLSGHPKAASSAHSDDPLLLPVFSPVDEFVAKTIKPIKPIGKNSGYAAAVEHPTTGLSTAGHFTAGPSTAGPSTAGPSTAGPSTAGHSTAGHSTAGHSTAGHSAAGPSTAGHSTAGPSIPGLSTPAEVAVHYLQTKATSAEDNHAVPFNPEHTLRYRKCRLSRLSRKSKQTATTAANTGVSIRSREDTIKAVRQIALIAVPPISPTDLSTTAAGIPSAIAPTSSTSVVEFSKSSPTTSTGTIPYTPTANLSASTDKPSTSTARPSTSTSPARKPSTSKTKRSASTTPSPPQPFSITSRTEKEEVMIDLTQGDDSPCKLNNPMPSTSGTSTARTKPYNDQSRVSSSTLEMFQFSDDDDDDLLFHDVQLTDLAEEVKKETDALQQEEARLHKRLQDAFDEKLSALMESTTKKRENINLYIARKRHSIELKRLKLQSVDL